MKYTEIQYRQMATKFNSLGLEGKLLLIRMHSDIFKLVHHKENWHILELQDEEAMQQEMDFLFELPNELTKEQTEGIKIY